jgi:uncharacterized tellurite resistance protein B-like protein
MTIQKILARLTGASTETTSAKREDNVKLATAALLLEIAYADESFSPVERDRIVDYLGRAFALSRDLATELISAAEQIRSRIIDHWALADHIRKNMSLDARMEIVRMMWRIVYADGVLTSYEEYLVRKIAGLLGLEHHLMIQAKLDAAREHGGEVERK